MSNGATRDVADRPAAFDAVARQGPARVTGTGFTRMSRSSACRSVRIAKVIADRTQHSVLAVHSRSRRSPPDAAIRAATVRDRSLSNQPQLPAKSETIRRAFQPTSAHRFARQPPEHRPRAACEVDAFTNGAANSSPFLAPHLPALPTVGRAER